MTSITKRFGWHPAAKSPDCDVPVLSQPSAAWTAKRTIATVNTYHCNLLVFQIPAKSLACNMTGSRDAAFARHWLSAFRRSFGKLEDPCLQCAGLNPIDKVFRQEGRCMVAAAKEFQTVADVMQQRSIDLDELVRSTGICRRIIQAIAHQRYTPSPQQREQVSNALRFPRQRIIWGHFTPVDEYAQVRP
jgi:hypothetical protein